MEQIEKTIKILPAMGKRLDERLRTKLIDAIAKGNTSQIKEALDEVNGKIFRVRNFQDMMIADAIKRSGKGVKISYELDSDFDHIKERVKNRKEKEKKGL